MREVQEKFDFDNTISKLDETEYRTAIGRKSAKPRVNHTKVRIVRLSEASLYFGVENHTTLGVSLKVTGPAKTVADCFKYRNKIGIDVAIEALREGLRHRRFTVDDLYRAALVCRVWNVFFTEYQKARSRKSAALRRIPARGVLKAAARRV